MKLLFIMALLTMSTATLNASTNSEMVVVSGNKIEHKIYMQGLLKETPEMLNVIASYEAAYTKTAPRTAFVINSLYFFKNTVKKIGNNKCIFIFRINYTIDGGTSAGDEFTTETVSCHILDLLQKTK